MVKKYNFFGKLVQVRSAIACAALAIGVGALLPGATQAQAISYAGPLVITQGGTYTGNYQSLSSSVPCVLVNTTAPVVLLGCNLSGAGNLIQSGSGGNLVVRNCTGTGLAPTVDNQAPGHFVDAYQSQSLVIEHNFFSGTSGIVVNRWSGAGLGPTLTVRYNRARNIDGRWRNGGGARASFLILNTVQHLPGVDVAYNEVLNTPDQSLVEDNINLYNSSGTAASPLHVHDNFVRGAYPFPATGGPFTGTGITTDGDAQTLAAATGFVEADHNQFVGIGNSAMNIASGHDVYYHDNRAVSSGYLPDGRRFSAGFCGLGVFNYYRQPGGVFANHRVADNTVGVVRWGGHSPSADRQDEAPDACAPCQGTVHLPGPVTLATEDNEGSLWAQKLQQNGVVVGPLGAAAPAPAPVLAPVVPITATGQVVNPGFEADGAASGTPAGWQATFDANAEYTESYAGAHTGTYHGTHYRTKAYEVYTYQVVNGLANGTYAFSAWVKSSGGQAAAQMRASNYGGPVLNADFTATPGGVTAPGWVLLTVANIVVTNGQCEIGFYSKASGSQAIYFDDVTLAPQQAAAPNVAPTVALTAASSIVLGQALALSATAADSDGTVAKVAFFNGTTKLGEATAAPYQLSWTPTAAGTYALIAVATDNAGAATTSAVVSVAVVAAPVAPAPAPVVAGANLVLNPGFEADGAAVGSPANWQTWTGQDTDASANYTEAYGGAHTGTYHATHYRTEAYEIYTYQVVQNVPAGSYVVRAWVKGGGGHQTQLRIKSYGGPDITVDAPATPDGQWVQVALPDLAVTSGQCEIGFYSKAGASQWLYFDDVELVAQNSPGTDQVAAAALLNPGFEAGGQPTGAPAGWQTATGLNTSDNVDYTEAYAGAHAGLYHGTHYSPEAYQVYTYQVAKGLPVGTYTLRAWVKSGGGQPRAEMRASNYGGDMRLASLNTVMNDWTLVQIPNISVTNGQAEIGFYSSAKAEQWLYFDDVEFVLQPTAAGANSALNASFDDDLTALLGPRQWTTQAFGATRPFASYTEAYPGAHSGLYHGTHYRPEAYEVYTYQVVKNLPAGTYTLRAWVKSSGGQPRAEVRASNYGGSLVSTAAPATPDGQWVQITVPNIVVSNGQCEIGFYSKASGGQWLYYDDVELVLQGGASATSATAGMAASALPAGPTLFPNPADGQVTVSVNFAQATAVTLVVTDMQGTPVARSQQQATAGDNQFTLDTSTLPSGIYTLQIQSSQPTLVQRLEVKH
ncbi:T9SS type A sorting domain-containing protein [Hymenobacter nivis]|uniref:Secretion system C-terminal sorting domain-containing protein n=1 Tax=Hymenobacter nivis TaxID=1850093 RepID=A0A2Z3GSY4_9BACT|nr:T9SS type A sorting domain-containing protein [Hymenobacter nivis]AWM34175.1 hypothetical protein DDQ68_16115 [Hymenobacter nivis]